MDNGLSSLTTYLPPAQPPVPAQKHSKTPAQEKFASGQLREGLEYYYDISNGYDCVHEEDARVGNYRTGRDPPSAHRKYHFRQKAETRGKIEEKGDSGRVMDQMPQVQHYGFRQGIGRKPQGLH